MATCSVLKAGSRASRSSRSFSAPCSATAWATARLWVRITSCSRCRSPPAFTPRISKRSVARNGSWTATCRAMTASRTSSPAATLVASTKIASLARNASGMTRRRFALSSSVRSSHWAAAVCQAFPSSSITKRAKLVIRSARMGFRLYAIAEEPTCALSNGSSISPSCCSSRRSVANSADAAALEGVEPVEQLLRVEQELLHPQGDALPDGGELRRLEVGVREARQLAVAARELRERDDDGRDPSQQQLQPLAHQQEVGVVGDVRAGRAEVNEGTRRRRLLAKMMDVRHHVVPQALLVLGRAVEIGVVEVAAELGQRAIGDVEPELLLGLQQREPEPPPQPDPPALAPQRLHRGGGVAGAERRGVGQTGAFARATRLFQSARNCSSPRSVRGCSNSFFRMSGGSVATSAPIIAASTTWRGCRIEAARICVAIW